jgi:amidohydrolase
MQSTKRDIDEKISIPPTIIERNSLYSSWRRDIHAHPELAFDEKRTSDFVVQKLEQFGIKVTRSVGGTGLVGTLSNGGSSRGVGLRADMDALPILEQNEFEHKSKYPGRMHACGHDGHTVMLLAAAEYLSQTKRFNGTVNFIFQPAEETGSGAQAMIDDGLFKRFSIDSVFSMHNAPNFNSNTIATRPGAIMASMETFAVEITGRGTHGAFPHTGTDTLLAASQMVTAWQSIVSRNINPQNSVAVSATSINSNDSWNVIPDMVSIKGSIRAISSEDRELTKRRFIEITESIAKAFSVSVSIDYQTMVPATYNAHRETELACNVAASIVGESNVLRDAPPVMGSEDFAYMLDERPGCYLWLGVTDPSPGHSQKPDDHISCFNRLTAKKFCMVHESVYDFNDSVIPTGAYLFARIAETILDG